jgi:hypothetical protein
MPELRTGKTGLAAARASRLTRALVKETLGVESGRRRSNASQNRQGEKGCNKDPHDYLL